MKTSIITIFVVLIVVLGLAIFMKSKPQEPGKLDGFASCLKEKGAVFYGEFWCPHCKEQKDLFSKSVKMLPYVECSTPNGQSQLQVCRDAGITQYPTWDFKTATGTERVVGTLSLEQLSSKTGCQLPQ
jgi:thiol-disulfide isomerase/thioredoxin